MINKYINQISMLLILFIAAFLRLYSLDTIPALNADEAAIGYNAYSLIETGMDEHGNTWPIHFQSFNDWKPGLYFYIVMPFVKIFGLSVWSVRLPNAFLGILSVLIIILLLKEIIKNKTDSTEQKDHYSKAPYFAGILLALSPWHIHFSRGAWEVNTATFFLLFGLYGFIRYIKNRNIFYFLLFVVSNVASLYTYHSMRIVAPLFVVGLLIIYRKILIPNIKKILIPCLIGVFLLVPLIYDFTNLNILSRASGVGLIADVGPIERTNEQRMEHAGRFSVLLHNKFVNYGFAFVKNWVEHYHGLFLFVSGDTIQRNAVPETGQMYLFEIVTIVIGLVVIFRSFASGSRHTERASGSKSNILYSKFYIIILLWLLVAPIPAALTFQSPHALRAQNMVIPLTIISAIGLADIINFIDKLRVRCYGLLGIFLHSTLYVILYTCILLFFFRYLHMYYKHMIVEYPYSSQYGLEELAEYLSKTEKEYKNIVITNRYDQPYILLLFYSKYPPEKFQKGHVLTDKDKYGFSTVESYDNLIFKSIDWDRDKLKYADSLIIGSNEEIPDETNITKRIYGSNDFLYFKVVEN